MDKGLQTLLDREAIKELTARYAMFVAAGDGRAMGALYTAEGSFRAGVADVEGRENIQEFLADVMRPGKNLPMVTNHVIEIDGSTATCFSMMYTPWYRHQQPGFCGAYRDRLRKEDGAWRFVERDFEFYEGRPTDA